MTTTIRNLVGYPVSNDYKRLVELMRQGSVVCTVRYLDCRYVAQTLYSREENGKEYFRVSARGFGYIDEWDETDFIRQCESNNLEFIIPPAALERSGV